MYIVCGCTTKNVAFFVPSLSNPTRFGSGWIKYTCKHGRCIHCFIEMIDNSSGKRPQDNKNTHECKINGMAVC